jgi:hypothetical protein
MDLAVGSKQG